MTEIHRYIDTYTHRHMPHIQRHTLIGTHHITTHTHTHNAHYTLYTHAYHTDIPHI